MLVRLALAALPLVACVSLEPVNVTQHGLIAAPRPASYDGQPMSTNARVEGHLSTARLRTFDGVGDSGAAVARHQAGGALRMKVGANADLGVEGDAAWSASETTLSGDSSASSGVPAAAVVDAAFALRGSTGSGPTRVGFALAVGLTSVPIHRQGQPGTQYSRDETGLVRVAIVPSHRIDNVTLYASVGGASQADVKEVFTWYPDTSSDSVPAVVAHVTDFVLTAAAGATFDLGNVRLTAQIGDAIGMDTHFGPQLMAGVEIDLGTAR